MKRITGSGLVEYIVPTAVVGLVVGLGIYYMASEGYLTKFVAASGNMKIDSAKGVAVIGNTSSSTTAPSTPTTAKGTPTEPVSSCTSGICTIDFGDFKLTNVPEDFGNFVKTNGNSGGTDSMMEIVKQLADVIDDPATPADEGADFRDMSNLGHFIARNEEFFEKNLEPGVKCENLEDTDCYKNLVQNTSSLALPGNISSILTNYAPTSKLLYTVNKDFAFIANEYNKSKTSFDLSKKDNPMYAFYDKYRKIMDDPSCSDTIKNVTQQAFLQVDDLTFNLGTNVKFFNLPDYSQSKDHINPVTGHTIETVAYEPANRSTVISNVMTPEPSKFTDFHSAVVCTAGKNVDAGAACHK